jgi:hypothetical protein
MAEHRPGFWSTLPGVLTAIAAVITSVSGAYFAYLGLRGAAVTSVSTAPQVGPNDNSAKPIQANAKVPPARTTPRAVIASHYSVGECTGAGGVEGVHFWGPPARDCNGIAEWGRYSSSERSVTALGSCKGHGGVEGVTLYGPPDSACAGIPVWGTYEGSASLENGIGSCVGRGNILSGQLLFGPMGMSCGGFPGWGKYQ